MYVDLKEAVFKPSNALRHATDLHSILLLVVGTKSVLYLSTDGGPDHQTTYVSTQLSLIALFLNMSLNYYYVLLELLLTIHGEILLKGSQ